MRNAFKAANFRSLCTAVPEAHLLPLKHRPVMSVLSVVLMLVSALLVSCAGTQKAEVKTMSPGTGIKGQVMVANEGAADGAFVYAYDSPFNDMRVPTKYISAPAGADGSYVLDLPAGTWYVVARQRVSGDPKGYLVKGDYEGKYMSNPVVVAPGRYNEVNLSISKLEGAFLLAPYLPDEIASGIRGTVYTESGKPAEGAYVMVYTDKEMIGLPAFLSKPSGNDGSYVVALGPGTYYVSARLKYGGLPRLGEPYGTYDANTDHMVVVEEKAVQTGVDISLKPFPKDLTKP